MASLQLFDQLLQFPLFLGMSRDDLGRIAGHTKLDFQKESARTVIYSEGAACTHLCFLLSGTVSVDVSCFRVPSASRRVPTMAATR